MKDKIKSTIFNQFKKTIMNNKKTEVRDKHADTIIRNHVIWSMGAGLIPILIADIFAVSALQMDMIRQLCKVYDLDFEETRGKAIVTSLTSSTLARLGARSLLKLIPGIGSYLGGVTVSIFAGASTYALGEVFKRHFESGGTILDFDADRVKQFYSEKFEKGKDIVKEWKNDTAESEDTEEVVEVETPVAAEEPQQQAASPNPTPSAPVMDADDPIVRLQKLADMRDAGVLTDEEFQKMKQKLIDEF